MTKIKDEQLKLDIIVNGNAGQKALGDLEQANRKLVNTNEDLRKAKQKLLAEGKKESVEYKNLTAQISANNTKLKENKAKMADLRSEIGITALTTRQLRAEQTRLKTILANTTPNTAAYKKYDAELQQVNTRLKELRLGSQSTGNSIDKMAGGVGRFLGAFGITAGIYGAITAVKKFTAVNVALEEVQADVMKTTGYTKQQVNDLTVSLKKLDTKTPVEQLLALAAAGGRLNLTGKELESYVKNTDTAFVSLGDSLDGDAQQIGLILGKLASEFDLEKKYGVGDSIGKIGSSLNELGAKSKATEGPILDFINRLAGVSHQAQISEPDVAALGALFDENGQSIEVAASTFNKLLPAIGKDVERFAGIAGMNVKDFKKIVENDAFEALKLVAKGAQSNQKGLLGLTETLQSYGIEQARAASIVGILSSKTDRLSELQVISNNAFEKGTSLQNEFNIKNETTGATLSKIGKIFETYYTGSKVQDFLRGISEGFLNLIKPTQDSTIAIRDEQTELFVLQTKIYDVNTKQEDRIKLIKQLQEKYPDYLGNLDAEKVSNEELSTAINLVNEELINKIVLQKKDIEVEKAATDAANKKIELKKIHKKAETALAEEVASGNIKLKQGISFEEQLASAAAKLRDDRTKGLKSSASAVEVYNQQLIDAQKAYNESLNETKTLSEERNKLAQELGIITESQKSGGATYKKGDKTWIAGLPFIYDGNKWVQDVESPTTTTTTKKAPLTDEQKKAAEEQKKQAEELTAFIKKQQEARVINQQEGLNKELAQIDAKYQTEIDKAQGQDNKVKELEALRDQEKADLKAQRTIAFNEREKELQNQIDLQNATDKEASDALKLTQQLDKDLAELDHISLTETQKGELKKKIIEKYNNDIDRLNNAAALKRLKEQLKFTTQEINFEQRKNEIKVDLAQQLGNALLSVLGNSIAGQLAAIALNAIIEVAKLKIATSAAQQINLANATASAPWPFNMAAIFAAGAQNIVLGAASKAQQAAIIGSAAISGLGVALNKKSSKPNIKGFESGYYPITRSDGKTFNAQISDSNKTQLVTKPTYFKNGNYLAGEGGPEIIIDTPTLKNLDPAVIKNIYATAARTRGFETGYYPQNKTTTAVLQNDIQNVDVTLLTDAIHRLILKLDTPIEPSPIYIGTAEIEKQKMEQDKLTRNRNNAKISYKK